MKVLLFNARDAFPIEELFPEPFLGISYIKSYFDKYSELRNNIEIKIKRKNVWNTILQERPDIIGICAVTVDYLRAIELAYRIKNHKLDSIIIIGGIHISNLPESLNRVFDVGVVGEGEIAMKKLLETISSHGLDREKISQIPGLVYYDKQGNFVNTGTAELIKDLDNIPIPYRDSLGLKTIVHMFTSRGCPYKCTFCSSTSLWRKSIRFNSAERVVEEMIELVTKYNARHISIWDDLFSINAKRLERIQKLIDENRKYLKGVTLGVTGRTDCLTEEICRLLKEINVKRVALGLESGSNRMLTMLKGGKCSVEGHKEAIRLLRKYGIAVTGGVIIGSPEETMEDLQKTITFVKSVELDGGGVGLAIPFPATGYWRYALEKGFVSKDMNFAKLVLVNDFTNIKESDFILLSDQVTKGQIIEIGKILQKYFASITAKGFFNAKMFTLRNLYMAIQKPSIVIPFIVFILKNYMDILIRSCRSNVNIKEKHITKID